MYQKYCDILQLSILSVSASYRHFRNHFHPIFYHTFSDFLMSIYSQTIIRVKLSISFDNAITRYISTSLKRKLRIKIDLTD